MQEQNASHLVTTVHYKNDDMGNRLSEYRKGRKGPWGERDLLDHPELNRQIEALHAKEGFKQQGGGSLEKRC